MRRRAGPLASAGPAAALPAPSRPASPRLREPELGEAGNEWGPRGGGAVGPGPAREGEEVGRRHLPWAPPRPTDPGRATEAQPGRPLLGGADGRRRGPGRGRAGPLGLLTSAMSCSSRPPAPRPARSRLRRRWARSPSGWPAGGPLGTGRGRAEPAGRAQTPLQAWGSRRLCNRPPARLAPPPSPPTPPFAGGALLTSPRRAPPLPASRWLGAAAPVSAPSALVFSFVIFLIYFC